MPFRPEEKVNPGSWLGFKEANITRIVNKKYKHDALKKLDVAISLDVETEGSKYPVELALFGNFDWESKNRIKSNGFLSALYRFFDTINFNGGVNIEGEWVDENDNKIDDIVEYLNDHIAKNTEQYPYYVYVYEEEGKNGKSYSKVWRRIEKNNEEGRKSLQEYIDFCKNRGMLNENKGPSKTVNIDNSGGVKRV